jgi:hypothetical protein
MKVLKENEKTVVVEFSKKEYHQIANWFIGKAYGNIEIDVKDTLQNFLNVSSFLNPEDNVQEILKSK